MDNPSRSLDLRAKALPAWVLVLAVFALAGAGLAETSPWTPIGPFGQNASVRALVVDPSNPSTIYAGVVDGATDLGGVFKSVDGGNSWTQTLLPSPYERAAIFALAISASSPSTVYAGGSETVFQSSDGGGSWQIVSGASGVTAIAIDTASNATVCFTDRYGFLFRTVDGGANWAVFSIGPPASDLVADPTSPHTFYLAANSSPGGVFKSTDGGAGWPVLTNGIEAANAQRVFVAPTQPATVFASMTSGVFRSTNGGASWTPVGPGLPSGGVTAFAASPRSPSTVYAATSDGLFRSPDAGLTWARLGVSQQVQSLAVDPDSGNTVYAGTNANGLLRSQDAGTSWSASNQGLFASTAVTALATDPLVPFSLYASTSPGGLFKSTDRGATWAAPGAGLGAAEMRAVVLDPSSPGVGYALDGRHVYKTTDGGGHWTVSLTWDEQCYCSTSLTALAIDPATPTTLYAAWTTIGHNFIINAGIFKSTDGGGSWTSLTWPFVYTPISALTVDRNSTIYAPGARSADGGATWQALEGPCNGILGPVAIATAPDATLYIACDPELHDVVPRVHRSTDGGTNWSDLAVSGTHIAVAPTDSRIVYVAGSGGVFRSSNAGATWSDESGGLPDPSTTALAIDPMIPSRVYAGTGSGVFTKDFSGAAEPFCAPSPTTLCLAGNRFKAEVAWSVPSDGRSGHGMVKPLTSDTGSFWFFSADNIELVLKVLDGRSLNDAFWVFYGALSDVQYTITVTDTQTGAIRTYVNPSGHLASRADTSAFPQSASTRAPARSARALERATAAELYGMYGALSQATARTRRAAADCAAGSGTLCLESSRFRVSVAWEVPGQGKSGDGVAVPMTGNTGYFWFFDQSNVELVVKVLDGDATNGHQWVFYGALSNVKYTITVEDTQTGAIRTYDNASGELASVADTLAF